MELSRVDRLRQRGFSAVSRVHLDFTIASEFFGMEGYGETPISIHRSDNMMMFSSSRNQSTSSGSISFRGVPFARTLAVEIAARNEAFLDGLHDAYTVLSAHFQSGIFLLRRKLHGELIPLPVLSLYIHNGRPRASPLELRLRSSETAKVNDEGVGLSFLPRIRALYGLSVRG